MTSIPPEVVAGAADLAKKGLITVLGPALLDKAKKCWNKDHGSKVKKDHGSKVKKGAFQDCSIEKFGNKACIVVNPKKGKILLLTSDTIASYEFVKEKFRMKKTYYYYEILFEDGNRSYVRMSSKYRDAMLSHT